MISRILFCAILLASGSATAARTCVAVRDAHTAAAVLHVEDLWVHALESRDISGLACILAPGFADVTWDGDVWTREQALKALPQRAPGAMHLGNMKVHIDGDAAIVRGVNTMLKPDGHSLATVDFTDMFKYRNGRWQAVGAQESLRH